MVVATIIDSRETNDCHIVIRQEVYIVTPLTHQLLHTTTARWYAECLSPGRAGQRGKYVQTIAQALRSAAGKPVDRTALVAAVGGRSGSTLYALFGRKAADALLNRHEPQLRATQPIRDVVDGLVVEAKVWSHWPHREAWLAQLLKHGSADRRVAADTLVQVLAAWAVRNPELAAALERQPPLSAVEDLLLICPNPIPAGHARDVLAEVIRLACDGSRPPAVLRVVQRDLAALVAGSAATAHDRAGSLIAGIAELLADLAYHVPTLTEDERLRLADAAGPQLTTALRIIAQGPAATS
jgi:hypothetical protein